MQKTLCLLLCLLVLGYASNSTTVNNTKQTVSSSNSTNKRVGVTASGNVPLYKNSKGFYAGVDLIKDDSSWPYFGSNTVAVELGLYTSQTLLSSNCLGFNKYDCQRYQCSVNTWIYNTIQYPYFTAAGPTASADAYLDYSHWNLEDYAFFASSCYGGGSSSYGANGMTGILGLGLNNQRQENNYYVSNPVFSLYLKPVTGNAGYLMFQKDLRFASSSQSIATWKTDKNWKGTVSGWIEVGSSSSTFMTSVSLVLDAAADTIGIPSSVYSTVIRAFTYAGVYCAGSNTRPTCSYGNYKSGLPKISIQLSYPSSGTFYIPPEVYVLNYSSYSNQTVISSFTLNIKALSSNLTLENYVTPAFDNSIILSADVLSQYYIVFDGSNSYSPSISLYNASNNPPTPGSIPWYGFAIGGVVLAALICACCRCCCRPKVIDVERPLILNDQTQYIQPAVPVINYNYPQQTMYTQQPQMIIQPQPQVIIQQQPQPQVYYNPAPTYYN